MSDDELKEIEKKVEALEKKADNVVKENTKILLTL